MSKEAPMKKPPQARPGKRTGPNASPTSKIDLAGLTVGQLRHLRDDIDALLRDDISDIGEEDLVLDFRCRLLTSAGTAGVNAGCLRLNRITSPRLIAAAPETVEQAFWTQVWMPVSSYVMELLESRNPTINSISSLQNNAVGFQSMLPASGHSEPEFPGSGLSVPM